MRAFGYVLPVIGAVGLVAWYSVTHPNRFSPSSGRSAGVAAPRSVEPEPAQTGCGEPCGTERWRIKTLSDAHCDQVDLTPRPARIEELTSLAPPADYPENERVAPEELQVYRIEGSIVEWSLQRDSDLHLVLVSTSSPGASLVAEIPDADCAGACASRFADTYRRARKVLVARLCPGGCPQRNSMDVPVPVSITGVGFFDRPHAVSGAAPNHFELHPVLSIEFKR